MNAKTEKTEADREIDALTKQIADLREELSELQHGLGDSSQARLQADIAALEERRRELLSRSGQTA